MAASVVLSRVDSDQATSASGLTKVYQVCDSDNLFFTMSNFSKDRGFTYFDQILQTDPMKLIKNYAIHPRDDVAGYVGDNLANNIGPDGDKTMAKVSKNRKIAYIHMFKKERGSVAVTGNEGGDVLHFDAQYAARPDYVPVYFLPWESHGGVIRLTIPPAQAGDPDVFFTAAINGCSVFFQGAPNNPTIYHAGGSTNRNDPNAAAKYWRDTVRSQKKDANAPLLGEVNKTHYIQTPGVTIPPPYPGAATSTTTATAKAYKDWLENKLSKSITLKDVMPWGCVMGIRAGGNWTFYLQENATVIWRKVSKDGTINDRYFGRPMAVREIFPGGGGIVDMKCKVPTKLEA